MAVNFGSGRASLHVEGLSARDFFNIPNALNNGGSLGATASFTIHWHGVTSHRHVRNDTLHVAGLFLQTHATIEWTATNAHGFTFTADKGGQTAVAAQLVHLRNGVFFP